MYCCSARSHFPCCSYSRATATYTPTLGLAGEANDNELSSLSGGGSFLPNNLSTPPLNESESVFFSWATNDAGAATRAATTNAFRKKMLNRINGHLNRLYRRRPDGRQVAPTACTCSPLWKAADKGLARSDRRVQQARADRAARNDLVKTRSARSDRRKGRALTVSHRIGRSLRELKPFRQAVTILPNARPRSRNGLFDLKRPRELGGQSPRNTPVHRSVARAVRKRNLRTASEQIVSGVVTTSRAASGVQRSQDSRAGQTEATRLQG